MRFELIVKSGQTELARVPGNTVDEEFISVADLNKVIEVEQYLEKLFGLRFHINTH
jgi:hypothetical protein